MNEQSNTASAPTTTDAPVPGNQTVVANETDGLRPIGSIGKRNGLFNNYRIPFGTRIRVTAQRSREAEADGRIWWIIRGVENGRVTLGGVQLPAEARLKLHRLEQQEVDPLAEFTLADISVSREPT